jgi:flagellar M-ring protein FliF
MTNFLQQMNDMTSRFTFNQKVLMIALGATAVLSVVIFSFWLQSEEMAVLFTNMSPEDASASLDELAKLDVEAELSNGGTTILVPEDVVHRMRVELSAQGIPSKGIVGWGIFDGKQYGMTEFVQNVNFKRALEGELTRTIESIQGIQGARVHLVLPKPSIFKSMQEPATASVVLTLGRNSVLGDRQIAGIQSLTANSVEGLELPNVSVIDQFGVVLSRTYDEGALGGSESQLAMKKEVDGYLSSKAASMLDTVLGAGRSIVRVDATLNFDRLEQQREIYDPDGTLLSEERSEVTGAEGEGGEETSVSNYEINKTIETVVGEIGGVKSLSVAVFVDGKHEGEDGGDAYTPLSDEELQQIERIVRTAVGFDAQRGDRVEVVNMPFQDTAALPAGDMPVGGGGGAAGLLGDQSTQTIIQLVSRIGIFIVAGMILLRMRKNLGEMMETPYVPSGADASDVQAATGVATGPSGLLDLDEQAATTEKILEEVKDFADDNTEDMADLVQAWISDSEVAAS